MAPKKAKCGTESGYRRHSRLEEKHCEKCKKAHRDYIAAGRARRAEREAAEQEKRKEEKVAIIKQTIRYNMDDIDEMADLIYLRNILRSALIEAAGEKPDKIAPLSREIRTVNLRINELIELENSSKETEDESTDIFSLAAVTPIKSVKAGGE